MAPRNFEGAALGDEQAQAQSLPYVPQGDWPKEQEVPMKIVWPNVVFWSIMHILGAVGVFYVPSCRIPTLAFAGCIHLLSALGITAGVHRLWSHRSYKAKWPLRAFLLYCNTLACQNDVIEWSRDHRVHHKYSETNADPHNALRGFFFAHMGWLLVRKHPEVKAKGKGIDMSDLYADPLLRFQRRHFQVLTLIISFLMPTLVCVYLWGESVAAAFLVCGLLRYLFTLHCTWLVNSAAHMWGNKPYDVNINPSENTFVSLGALGEGFHNYHHTFPQDYKTSEFFTFMNPTAYFIELMARLGLAYDLKTVTEEMILARRKRTGDLRTLEKKMLKKSE